MAEQKAVSPDTGCHPSAKLTDLKRRNFLLFSGLVLASLAVPTCLQAACCQAATGFMRDGRMVLFLAADNGRLLESEDDGRTWQVNINFGRECRITAVHSAPSCLLVDLSHHGYPFTLRSGDGYRWIS